MERNPGAGRQRLLALPRADRRAGLVELVSAEFKRVLLLTAADDLPMDESYFDLGLTSLKAAELKERLERDLGCELDTSTLFDCATVRQVVDYLAGSVFGEPSAEVREPAADDPRADHRRLVAGLLQDLYDTDLYDA